MKFCSKCGNELADEAIFCPACGCAVEPAATAPKAEDKVSVGLCILSFLIPLVGIIYWALKHKETPKKAKACGFAGIAGWAFSFVFGIVFGIVGGLLGGAL